MQLLGVAGSAGAGKDSVIAILTGEFNFEDLSTSDVGRAITRHIYRLPPDFMPVRDQLFAVNTFLRTEFGSGFLVKICLEQAKLLGLKRVLITGLRSLGEAEAVRSQGGKIIAIQADAKVRYERIVARARDVEAKKTFEEFRAQDEKENSGVDGKGVSAIVESADLILENNGNSMDALKQLVREKVSPLSNPPTSLV